MSSNIDPVDAIIGGFISPLKIWFLTLGIMIFTALTFWPANFEEAHPIYLITILLPLLDWFEHPNACIIGVAMLVAIFGISYFTMQDRLSPKVYVFGIYSCWFIFFLPTAIDVGRWYLPVLVYLTIAMYFWYVWPLMHRQRDRAFQRDRMG